MGERKAFKDWFDQDAAKAWSEQMSSVLPDFNRTSFMRKATKDLHKLEFHDRVHQFASALRETLPEDYPKAVGLLIKSMPPEKTDCEAVGDGWILWPLGFFIASYGTDHYQESMHAMVEMTQRFSAEFAVRPFAMRYPDRIYGDLLELAQHDSPHVRRWCSEGIRPRLPWGKTITQLVDDPSPALPILESLKDDPELYVRRSVANHLNDIAKDHPEITLAICKRWSKGAKAERKWIIKHGLRTLIKDGNPKALAILGFKKPEKIDATLSLDKQHIKIGEAITMQLSLQNNSHKSQNLILDYSLNFVRKNGATSAKVFKWKNLTLAKGEAITLTKKHSLRETTVRALYAGKHHINIQINGEQHDQNSFDLTD